MAHQYKKNIHQNLNIAFCTSSLLAEDELNRLFLIKSNLEIKISRIEHKKNTCRNSHRKIGCFVRFKIPLCHN